MEDDLEFELVLEKTLESMGRKIEAVCAERQEYVISRLEEEMKKLRPHKHRLLHGSAARPPH